MTRLMRKTPLLAAVLPFLLLSCAETDHKGKTPVAEVDGTFVYMEDLRGNVAHLPAGIDSAEVVGNFVKERIEDILLYDKAKENISDGGEIDRLVEEYRESLVVNEYLSEIVKQKFNDTVSWRSITDFYENNRGLFVLSVPYMKGIYLKIPKSDKNIGNVRKWMRMKNSDDRDKIENVSIRNAAEYLYFMDEWRRADDFARKVPGLDFSRYAGAAGSIEKEDDTYAYFLYVDSLYKAGETAPLSLAERDLREMLFNMQKMKFVKRLKEDLFNEAEKKGSIIYYDVQE